MPLTTRTDAPLAGRLSIAPLALAVLMGGAARFPHEAHAQVTQITDQSQSGCVSFAPVVNAAGTRFVFESTCNPVGANADGNREIFRVTAAGTVTQLTDTTGCANANPAVDGSGDVVAFDSDCDLVGDNADGSVEIFVRQGNTTSQVTDGQICASFAPSLNRAGDRVAYDSDCDLVGNNVERSSEIFQTVLGGQTSQLTSDKTGDGCGSFNASSNAAGNLIAFESDCDLTGGNVDEITEIHQVSSAGVVTQMTSSLDDACISIEPASDAGGTHVAFESNCDFVARNPDGAFEIFRVAAGGQVAQLSDSGDVACDNVMAAISSSGETVVFSGYCDPFGTNADESFEIFRAGVTTTEQLTDAVGCASLAPALALDSDVAVFVSDCDLTGDNADGSDELFLVPVPVCGVCGAPLSANPPPARPTASDALFILKVAVGLGTCALCECDVDSSQSVTATDALRVLKAATGQSIPLACP